MIAVAGEALIDLIVDTDDTVRVVPGGGPLNAARTIARLGYPCSFLGLLSTDRFGAQLRRVLTEDGVTLPIERAVDLPTALAVAELDASGGASYTFHAEGTSAAGLLPGDLRHINLDGARALHIGSLGLALEPMASTLHQLVRRLPDRLLLMVDLNCRPAAIPDPPAYRARLADILTRADIVKASRDDLEFFAPGIAVEESAMAMAAEAPKLVILTAEAGVVRLAYSNGMSDLTVPSVKVVDTVGAGDAFGAAFLTWWVREDNGRRQQTELLTINLAATKAAIVAADTCTRRGADPPLVNDLALVGW